MKRPVTNHEHARIVALCRAGKTLDDVAGLLDRAPSTISRHTTGFPRQKGGMRRAFDYGKALELIERHGLSYRTLGERFGVTAQAVYHAVRIARHERALQREAA